MNYENEYRVWLAHCGNNAELRQELEDIRDDDAAREDRFYRELSFGTGGLRGVLGAGSNRMNGFTVARASRGTALYLLGEDPAASVAIAYDSRLHSADFARIAAAVFAASGVRVWLYDSLMPTPSLSYAVRALGCTGGVVVTASHNPSEYNGYKVYGADGCQITEHAAEEISRRIAESDPFLWGESACFDAELRKGTVAYMPESVRDGYIAAVEAASLLGKDVSRDVSIVYTPLNGTGIRCVPRVLREMGFTDVRIPPEQAEPNGRFPTCPYPNPEEGSALAVGLALARETGSALLLATDPDCDRVGVAVRDGEDYRRLTGNEVGLLLFDFVCRMRAERGTMPGSPVAVKTIVTTPLAERIAARYGVELREVLTGFKYIGDQIGALERNGEAECFVFGFEESCGYLSHTQVRDKDAANAALLIAEAAAWYAARGMTLADGIEEIYAGYGRCESILRSYTFPGAAGLETMKRKMSELRAAPPGEIAHRAVCAVSDYQKSVTRFADGREEKLSLPASDVLLFDTADGAKAVVRPSGTEPKIKIYITAGGKDAAECRAACTEIGEWFAKWVLNE